MNSWPCRTCAPTESILPERYGKPFRCSLCGHYFGYSVQCIVCGAKIEPTEKLGATCSASCERAWKEEIGPGLIQEVSYEYTSFGRLGEPGFREEEYRRLRNRKTGAVTVERVR